MRLALLAVLLVPAVASAGPKGPLSLGVHAGSLQAESDANAGYDAQTEYGLFARYSLSPRIAAQLDLSKLSMRSTNALDASSATIAAVFDIVEGKKLVPTVLVGLGVEFVEGTDYQATAQRTEIGLGLEYRGDSGMFIGVDARIGKRKVSEAMSGVGIPEERPINDVTFDESYEPASLSAGSYRTVRVSGGIRF